MEKTAGARSRRFCTGAVLILSGVMLGLLVAAGFLFAGHLGMWDGNTEAFRFVRLNVLESIVLPLAALGTAVLLHGLLTRFAHVHLSLWAAGLWAALVSAFIVALGAQQVFDAATVMEGARLFARGSYKPMSMDYFNVYSYQLTLCLPMEILARMLPGIDLNLLMQLVNVVMSVGAGLALTAFTGLLVPERRAKEACAALLLLVLPAPMYCIHVYGTIPMIFFTSLALLFFGLYVRTGKARFALAYVLMLAAAYLMKLNAAIALIALLICAVLDAVKKKKVQPVLYALLSVLLSVFLASASVWQYEVRSGVSLRENVSTLARFTMGLQDGKTAAGWFNNYTEQFFPAEVTPEMEKEIASRDLAARLAEMKEDPKGTAAFFAEKYFSQWLEPSYNVLRYGQATDAVGAQWTGKARGFAGPMGGTLAALFEEGNPARRVLEALLHGTQQALLLLTLAGLVQAFKRRDDVLQTILPLLFFGAVLYHLLFEAKSQYAYPYMVYLVPVAAQGLCAVEAAVRRRWSKK